MHTLLHTYLHIKVVSSYLSLLLSQENVDVTVPMSLHFGPCVYARVV